jgi:demethylmenaquinone methyltransferase/2-methoxy-6-polyprenyl-1,4-benzoquinol methylase
MPLSKSEIRTLYGRRARHYDVTANLYYLVGFREWSYRKKAVRALRLSPGDTVVEIGCGTGLNFTLLQEAIGPTGQIIGVDLTEAMLAQARERAERAGWHNVEIVHSDAAEYDFPAGVNGILSTFALTLVPEYEQVIARGARALAPRGRWVVADLKLPGGWSARLFPLLLPLFRPFGVTADLAERHPWESVCAHTQRCAMKEYYFGYTYIVAGGVP